MSVPPLSVSYRRLPESQKGKPLSQGLLKSQEVADLGLEHSSRIPALVVFMVLHEALGLCSGGNRGGWEAVDDEGDDDEVDTSN